MKPTRECSECVHEFACNAWRERRAQSMDAVTCTYFARPRDTAAYALGRYEEWAEMREKYPEIGGL